MHWRVQRPRDPKRQNFKCIGEPKSPGTRSVKNSNSQALQCSGEPKGPGTRSVKISNSKAQKCIGESECPGTRSVKISNSKAQKCIGESKGPAKCTKNNCPDQKKRRPCVRSPLWKNARECFAPPSHLRLESERHKSTWFPPEHS